jgi:hypothetical protein
MSREFNIRPQDMADVKLWHIDAMRLYLEQLNRG